MLNLLEYVYTRISTDATMKTLLGSTATDSKVYPELPEKFENFPCMTYAEIGASSRRVPKDVQDIVIEFHIYSKVSKIELENINQRIYDLLNCYGDSQGLTYMVYARQRTGLDLNERDRQLFGKVVSYQVWARNSNL